MIEDIRHIMIKTVAQVARLSTVELLDAQKHSEAAFRTAVTSLQHEACAAFGGQQPKPVDFSPLSAADFPTTLLEGMLADR